MLLHRSNKSGKKSNEVERLRQSLCSWGRHFLPVKEMWLKYDSIWRGPIHLNWNRLYVSYMYLKLLFVDHMSYRKCEKTQVKKIIVCINPQNNNSNFGIFLPSVFAWKFLLLWSFNIVFCILLFSYTKKAYTVLLFFNSKVPIPPNLKWLSNL